MWPVVYRCLHMYFKTYTQNVQTCIQFNTVLHYTVSTEHTISDKPAYLYRSNIGAGGNVKVLFPQLRKTTWICVNCASKNVETKNKRQYRWTRIFIELFSNSCTFRSKSGTKSLVWHVDTMPNLLKLSSIIWRSVIFGL